VLCSHQFHFTRITSGFAPGCLGICRKQLRILSLRCAISLSLTSSSACPVHASSWPLADLLCQRRARQEADAQSKRGKRCCIWWSTFRGGSRHHESVKRLQESGCQLPEVSSQGVGIGGCQAGQAGGSVPLLRLQQPDQHMIPEIYNCTGGACGAGMHARCAPECRNLLGHCTATGDEMR
jgi:hypothetical protein